MPAPTKSRKPRYSPEQQAPAGRRRISFYREEFLKHRQCLEHQREYYSEQAIRDVETALTRIIGQLDYLCNQDDGDRLVSCLLRKFDIVTGLSQWTDPKKLH